MQVLGRRKSKGPDFRAFLLEWTNYRFGDGNDGPDNGNSIGIVTNVTNASVCLWCCKFPHEINVLDTRFASAGRRCSQQFASPEKLEATVCLTSSFCRRRERFQSLKGRAGCGILSEPALCHQSRITSLACENGHRDQNERWAVQPPVSVPDCTSGSDRKTHWQIEAFFVFAAPALQGIFGRRTQLQNGRPGTFAEPEAQVDGTDPIFVRNMNYLL